MRCTEQRRADWEARYQQGDLHWDKGEPAPGLVDFLAAQPGLQRGSVVVPGCGTGHDVRAWVQAGFAATGLDIAPSAVRLAVARTLAADLEAGFHEVDFLNGTPPQPFDWVFEHTLFCAIDPGDRDAYASAVPRWLRPGGNFLAIHYRNPEQPEGPPFGVSRDEIEARFAGAFELVDAWVPRSFPNRVDRELMFWWRRRD
ncbi:MAG: methyltransferase domain-containing protein [Verrucomicrobiales bacterium]|nr:methyltransferase domain-containing protein [Verrucomicrobiales bacterium]MCP5528262.1 methyltransferase domain-containing protein [Verrucomicrobiales bacterium]